ncbi:MAG: FecR domain-containing protein, partial [Hyphomicrobiales bacterium]|nr:FecR domain-containing protein [Hyphomicrobiales bacterium]
MAYNPAQGGFGIAASSSSAFSSDESQFDAAHLGDASHAASIIIPDAELLFRGHFARAGSDLVLTGPDGHRHIVPGYFNGAHHPTLHAPNGARLTPDVIDLLAGVRAPIHYAQAQAPQAQPPEAIGKVEKVVGIVNVVRNGVAVALHVGDAVYKTDVVETAADSSCGISFPDGSALNIVANSRLALNDYSFDPNSTSNAALFTLVEGTFAFVAGKVAHTGDMRIATPVATMGIRGTTGIIGT